MNNLTSFSKLNKTISPNFISMKSMKIALFFLFYFIHCLCSGQTYLLDSCGINSNPVLNQYEIKLVDSVLFKPFVTKKGRIIDRKHGFDFTGKKIAFYSCTKNSNTKGNGLLSKQEFFGLFDPYFRGHAGNGIILFNAEEKAKSNGVDAVIIIDCPYDFIKNEEIISQIIKRQK